MYKIHYKIHSNLHSLTSVDGQESWNFFKNDFSNHIPAIRYWQIFILYNTASF